MAKFIVEVEYKMRRKINVYAADEAEAEEKACDVVRKWDGIVDAEAIDTERDE